MIRPIGAAFVLLYAAGAAAAGPSGCAKAKGQSERVICADPALAALETEATRLGSLAAMGLAPARKKEFSQGQASFAKTLIACKEDKPCLQRTLVEHIFRLRQGYAEARSKDGEGISLGPFVAACPGLDAPIAVTFVNSDPAYAFLAWRDKSVVLQQAVAASGARYTGAFGSGDAQFWNKGKGATLDLPGKPPLNCEIQEGG